MSREVAIDQVLGSSDDSRDGEYENLMLLGWTLILPNLVPEAYLSQMHMVDRGPWVLDFFLDLSILLRCRRIGAATDA